MRISLPGTEALQWIGLFTAPLAWTVQLVLGYGATLAACGPAPGRFGLSTVTWEATLTVGAAVLALSGEEPRSPHIAGRAATDCPDERRRFFAEAAMLASILFLLAILLSGIAATSEAPSCRQS